MFSPPSLPSLPSCLIPIYCTWHDVMVQSPPGQWTSTWQLSSQAGPTVTPGWCSASHHPHILHPSLIIAGNCWAGTNWNISREGKYPGWTVSSSLLFSHRISYLIQRAYCESRSLILRCRAALSGPGLPRPHLTSVWPPVTELSQRCEEITAADELLMVPELMSRVHPDSAHLSLERRCWWPRVSLLYISQTDPATIKCTSVDRTVPLSGAPATTTRHPAGKLWQHCHGQHGHWSWGPSDNIHCRTCHTIYTSSPHQTNQPRNTINIWTIDNIIPLNEDQQPASIKTKENGNSLSLFWIINLIFTKYSC